MRYWLWVYFSFEGRIGRRTWWGAISLLGLIHAGVVTAAISIVPHEGIWRQGHKIALYILSALSIYNSLALNVKRFHDQGMSGLWNLLAILVNMSGWLLFTRGTEAAEDTPMLISAVVWVWLLIQLGLMPGQRCKNDYGEEPGKAPAA